MSDQTHLASGPRGHAGGAADTRREKRTTGLRIWMGAAAIAAALAWGGPAAAGTPVLSDEPDAKVSSNESRIFASSEPLAEGFKVERVGYVGSPFKEPHWKKARSPSEIVMQRLDDLQTSLEERLTSLENKLNRIQRSLDEVRDPLETDVILLSPSEEIDWEAILDEIEAE